MAPRQADPRLGGLGYVAEFGRSHREDLEVRLDRIRHVAERAARRPHLSWQPLRTADQTEPHALRRQHCGYLRCELRAIGGLIEHVEAGTIADRARLLIDGEIRGELEFSDVGKGLSPFPFVLMLEQSKTEHLLYEYLQKHDQDVLWKTEL
jgi:hypothetical protein